MKASAMAKKAKIAVVVAGLPDSYESEGFDRENMKMPNGHYIRGIKAMLKKERSQRGILIYRRSKKGIRYKSPKNILSIN